jgi:hypothetical protein
MLSIEILGVARFAGTLSLRLPHLKNHTLAG